MASRVVFDSKNYFKCAKEIKASERPYPGYKDYKVIGFLGGAIVDLGDSYDVHSKNDLPAENHTFERDGFIRQISIHLVTLDLTDLASVGGGCDQLYVRYNQAHYFASSWCAVREEGAIGNTHKRNTHVENVVFPDLWIPVEEDDYLDLLISCGDYGAGAGDGHEFDWRAWIHFIEK